jgi:hypothetical protein
LIEKWDNLVKKTHQRKRKERKEKARRLCSAALAIAKEAKGTHEQQAPAPGWHVGSHAADEQLPGPVAQPH